MSSMCGQDVRSQFVVDLWPLLSRTGGIRPPERKRSRLALRLSEREEISRAG